jgi:hypothetical protein
MSDKRCGAKTRSGRPCPNHPFTGATRCRMHGGKGSGAPKGNQNAVTHGFYAKGLHPAEAEIWADISLGTLDDEIKLCRIQLARVTAHQRRFEDAPEDETLLTLTEVSEGESTCEAGRDSSRDVTRKRPDYHKIILALTGRIADLEARRKILIDGGERKFHTVNFIIEE